MLECATKTIAKRSKFAGEPVAYIGVVPDSNLVQISVAVG